MSVKTKNDVEYLMLSDPKPAGCESQDIVSGYAWMGTVSGYKEIGDEEIRVFLSSLPMGEYQISHRLRAERPGRFSALPAVLEAMYAPELRGNSREHKISISCRSRNSGNKGTPHPLRRSPHCMKGTSAPQGIR